MEKILTAIAAVAPLIDRFGVPFLQQMVNMFSKGTPPTADDWNALIALTAATARQKMLEVLAANGIDPNSDKGKAFLALVP